MLNQLTSNGALLFARPCSSCSDASSASSSPNFVGCGNKVARMRIDHENVRRRSCAFREGTLRRERLWVHLKRRSATPSRLSPIQPWRLRSGSDGCWGTCTGRSSASSRPEVGVRPQVPIVVIVAEAKTRFTLGQSRRGWADSVQNPTSS